MQDEYEDGDLMYSGDPMFSGNLLYSGDLNIGNRHSKLLLVHYSNGI